MNNNKLKTLTLALTCAAAFPATSHAALLTDIDGEADVDNYNDVDFSGQSVTTTTDNWGHNDNFSGADFSNTTLTIGDGGANGNQPFVFANITNANFSGATFNITPYHNTGNHRFNAFRGVVGTGASFVNSNWNYTFASTLGFTETDFFSAGSGAADLANKADAYDFSGANFSFSGASAATLNDDVAALLITNLGGIDAGTNIGAKYDVAFVSNNFADFGYVSGAALETALDTAGWQAQAVPEPSSAALLGLGGLALILRRRK